MRSGLTDTSRFSKQDESSMSSGFAYSTSSAKIMSRNKRSKRSDNFTGTSGIYRKSVDETPPRAAVTLKPPVEVGGGYQALGHGSAQPKRPYSLQGLTMVCGQQKLDLIQQNIQKQLAQAATWVKGSMVLICLLGVTWIIGIFYVSKGTKFFAYLFTIVNSLQGLFIFLFHCILNEKIRYEMLKKINCCNFMHYFSLSSRKYYDTSTGSVSNKTFSSGYTSSRINSSGGTKSGSRENSSVVTNSISIKSKNVDFSVGSHSARAKNYDHGYGHPYNHGLVSRLDVNSGNNVNFRSQTRRHTNASIGSLNQKTASQSRYIRQNNKKLDSAVKYKFKMELEKSVYKKHAAEPEVRTRASSVENYGFQEESD